MPVAALEIFQRQQAGNGNAQYDNECDKPHDESSLAHEIELAQPVSAADNH